MSEYELRFSRMLENLPVRVSFLAEDATSALIMAHDRASDPCAELWRDGAKLCTIKRRPMEDNQYSELLSYGTD